MYGFFGGGPDLNGELGPMGDVQGQVASVLNGNGNENRLYISGGPGQAVFQAPNPRNFQFGQGGGYQRSGGGQDLAVAVLRLPPGVRQFLVLLLVPLFVAIMAGVSWWMPELGLLTGLGAFTGLVLASANAWGRSRAKGQHRAF